MPALKSALFRQSAAGAARLAVNLVLPPCCPGCGAAVAAAHALCSRCWSQVQFIAPPLCPVYGTPFGYEMGEGIVSAAALADPPPFRRCRSATIYGEVTSRLVHQVKYYDRPQLAQVMATAMYRAGRPLLDECRLIVPVPLFRWRLWRRRFNQSAVLAEHLASLSGVPHDPLALLRVRPTRQQVGLSAAQREANVRNVFRVPDSRASAVAGAAVLLVDDVYTSGATAKAATRALLRGGAACVDVLTFARVHG